MVRTQPNTRRGRANGLQQTKKYASLNASHAQANARAERAAHLAATDALTGLPNLLGFQIKLKSIAEQRYAEARNLHRRADDAKLTDLRQRPSYALLFVDLDKFKQINDTLGHDTGDKVLKHTAESMKHAVRKEDFVARIGGDEFVVLLSLPPGCTEPLDIVGSVGNNIQQRIQENPLVLGDKARKSSVGVTTSIGGAMLGDGASLESMRTDADFALYKAKGETSFNGVPLTAEGTPKNRVALYIPGMVEPMLYSNYKAARAASVSFASSVTAASATSAEAVPSRNEVVSTPQSSGMHVQ